MYITLPYRPHDFWTHLRVTFNLFFPQCSLLVPPIFRTSKIFWFFDVFRKHQKAHCVKSVQIRNFFWSDFPVFGLNTEVNYRKIQTGKNSVFGHFSCSGNIGRKLVTYALLCEKQIGQE